MRRTNLSLRSRVRVSRVMMQSRSIPSADPRRTAVGMFADGRGQRSYQHSVQHAPREVAMHHHGWTQLVHLRQPDFASPGLITSQVRRLQALDAESSC